MKEHEAVFLKRQNLVFSIAAGSISFVFCFRINIFIRKIYICCYLTYLLAIFELPATTLVICEM